VEPIAIYIANEIRNDVIYMDMCAAQALRGDR
jgi:hypothetical protein